MPRKTLKLPEAPLSVIQRLWIRELGDGTGSLWGGPWLWPVRREQLPPLRHPSPDNELCNQCGLCIDFCPEGIIFKAEKGVTIDYTYCTGCMICVNECKRGAMKAVEVR